MDDKEREQEILDAIDKLMEVSDQLLLEHQEVMKEYRRLKEELAAIRSCRGKKAN